VEVGFILQSPHQIQGLSFPRSFCALIVTSLLRTGFDEMLMRWWKSLTCLIYMVLLVL
jgi:hypothetical protein